MIIPYFYDKIGSDTSKNDIINDMQECDMMFLI